MERQLPERPEKLEEVYVEYDEDGWSVFGTDSGFCYAQPATEEEAEEIAKNHNKHLTSP